MSGSAASGAGSPVTVHFGTGRRERQARVRQNKRAIAHFISLVLTLLDLCIPADRAASRAPASGLPTPHAARMEYVRRLIADSDARK